MQVSTQRLLQDVSSNQKLKATELNHTEDKDEEHQGITKIEKLQWMQSHLYFSDYKQHLQWNKGFKKWKTPQKVNALQKEFTKKIPN